MQLSILLDLRIVRGLILGLFSLFRLVLNRQGHSLGLFLGLRLFLSLLLRLASLLGLGRSRLLLSLIHI